MRLVLIAKSDLDASAAEKIRARAAAPEHRLDSGPVRVWDAYATGLFAFFEPANAQLIGLAEASGPPNAVNAGWWIDSWFRGQGYGNELVDLLAAHLRRRGYSGVGPIAVVTHNGVYDDVSRRLRERFKVRLMCGSEEPSD